MSAQHHAPAALPPEKGTGTPCVVVWLAQGPFWTVALNLTTSACDPHKHMSYLKILGNRMATDGTTTREPTVVRSHGTKFSRSGDPGARNLCYHCSGSI